MCLPFTDTRYSACVADDGADRSSTVVKVLCYKLEGRWFDPSFHFSLTQNPSGRTMALGSTQSLTEMSTRSISWG